MKCHFLLPLAALLIAASSFAQTTINFSDVRGLDGRDSLQGSDASIQLDKPVGALLMNTGNVVVMVNAKVVTYASPTSSTKDPAEGIALDITVKAGKQKQNMVVHIPTDKDRSGWLKEPFIFQSGSNTRTIFVAFTYTIE